MIETKLSDYFSKLIEDETISNFFSNIDGKISQTIVSSSTSQRAILLTLASSQVVYVARDLENATIMKSQIDAIGKKAKVLYSFCDSPIFSSFQNDEMAKFTEILCDFFCGKIDVLIVLPTVLCQRVPERQFFEESPITIKVSGTCAQDVFEKKLISLGYLKKDEAQTVGEYAKKGDSFNIFYHDNVLRVSFFDDEIEDIKLVKFEDYTLIEKLDSVTVYPRTIYYHGVKNEQETIKALNSSLNGDFVATSKTKLSSTIERLIEKLTASPNDFCHPFLTPFIDYLNNGFLHLFNKEIVCFDESKRVYDELQSQHKSFISNLDEMVKSGELLFQHKDFYYDFDKAFDIPNGAEKIVFESVQTKLKEFKTEEKLEIKNVMPIKYVFSFDELADDVNHYKRSSQKVLIFAGSKSSSENILGFLATKNTFTNDVKNILTTTSGVYVLDDYLPYSANFVDQKLVIIGTNDLVRKKASIAPKDRTRVFYLPKVGDMVVHTHHGIGRCVALERLKLTNVEKDYFVVEYRGGDRLYVPSEQADMLSAYMGGEGSPKLSKIGGQEFQKAKERVLASVKDMAKELITLYSQRHKKNGYQYPEDSYLQKIFEDAFPYEETNDQLLAIAEIKKDMEQGKIMDRLVCGDVGYGKTEVALRAAYKVVQEGKQVAFLCPTTILSQQHYNTCQKRFDGFMVETEVLNRFRTQKEQGQIIEKLKAGKIDVICGTHRLLAKDVLFKDLGLLILDEEQRFGVADKEKIKKLKQDVDVITLSATPIPRTLHMSLSGIRDISIIQTPPKERLPIQTSVSEFSEGLLVDACRKELARKGQILVVYNKVESIDVFTSRIRALIPEARVGMAHGQMPERELERAIDLLYRKEYDIMVATTLIENGVDLPMANTLFVVDADRLGLSQLYQLRGRIGRGNKLAYAYFTYDRGKELTPQAYSRLDAILQFTELGSGFRIAMRDLEIRGAGNVLGSEQHGQMEAVGYDLYCKLLSQGIKMLKGELGTNEKDVKLEIAVSAFIPDDYIQSEDARIKAYTTISEISTDEELENVKKSLKNDFGELPESLNSLLKIAYAKNLSKKCDIKKIVLSNRVFELQFYDNNKLVEKSVSMTVSKFQNFCSIRFDKEPKIIIAMEDLSIKIKLDFLINLLKDFIS